MDAATPNRHPTPTAARILRLFLKRVETRSTLMTVLLVAIVVAAALASLRNGAAWGRVTGREETDDAYVRADQIGISSHIAATSRRSRSATTRPCAAGS